MRSHERRLERLERRHAAERFEPPQFLITYIDMAREPVAATLLGSDITIDREPGESLEAFERRVDALGLSG